ncbi:tyrosine-protein kinase SRK3 [Xenopus tropicalis]|uniref:non-specific protein-tyrosine kinase n=1 Tax=Xenopus tropicalis TaxID=8364 RepID=A0A8J1J135_XENTR|nr:tyrosine-protein kinase SRK3 [Xenopus tropicalis]
MAAADLRDELTCSICQDIYTDPVTLPCGHNFCRGCIEKTWDWQKSIEEDPSCPECRERYRRQPDLKRNLRLSNIAKRLFSTHPEPDGTGNSGNRTCSAHNEPLKYLCCEDGACICESCCLAGGHRGHRVELSEASEKKKEKPETLLTGLAGIVTGVKGWIYGQEATELILDTNSDHHRTPEGFQGSQAVAQQSDQWERPRSEFKLVKHLEAGDFGEVWEGLWNDKDKVAIKTFKEANESHLKNEVDALKTLRHRNLIQLYAVCSVGEPVYIVTELMSKGSLLQFLKGNEGPWLTDANSTHIISQVAEGMAYLENKHVLHITLAARNVLVGEELLCKIADFGLARILKSIAWALTQMFGRQGGWPRKENLIRWTAPEVLTRYRYTAKSDVWSFGIVMYEVFMLGRTPYLGMNNQEVKDKVTSGYRLPKPDDCSPDIYNLMLECWQKNPNRRPSFFELVEKLTAIQCSLQLKSWCI